VTPLHLRSAAPRALAALLVSSAPVLVLSCASPSRAAQPGSIEVAELEPLRVRELPPEPIGKFLADLDLALRRWNDLMLTAKNADERRQARLLQGTLERNTRQRMDELIEQLESGPPQNRVRAAPALGFTRAVEAQSPLLAALADPSPDVVHNALLGLALLERADTPLDPICEILSTSHDPETRSNAAYALRSIVAAGGSGECALSSARLALVDPEPFVRVQAALVLGMQRDAGSIEPLADLLYDPVLLVSQGAIEALAMLGRDVPAERGRVARSLAAALAQFPSERKPSVRRALIQLAEIDYGEDEEEWMRWAQRLP